MPFKNSKISASGIVVIFNMHKYYSPNYFIFVVDKHSVVENVPLAKSIEMGITDHIIEYLFIFPCLNDAYDSQVFLDSRHLATETFHE